MKTTENFLKILGVIFTLLFLQFIFSHLILPISNFTLLPLHM